MSWLLRFAVSSIGAKVVMAATGVGLIGFVIAHMVGNLQIFLGQDAFNNYGVFMKQTVGKLLWLMRAGLLGVVVLHILSGLRLARLNRAARPVAYASTAHSQSTLASRTMAMTGLVLLAYIVYHLLHFTIGVTHPEHFNLVDSQGRHDIYSMFILGFQQPVVAISYVLANGLLAVHLSHGARSFFQSLGLRAHKYEAMIRAVGYTVAVVVGVPNMLMPLAVLSGFIGLPGGGE